TRCYRDWSSDVCSSDLEAVLPSSRSKPIAILRRRLFCSPAARVRRKDLEGVAADLVCSMRRILKTTRNRSVYAYSHKLHVAKLKIGRASCTGRGEIATV